MRKFKIFQVEVGVLLNRKNPEYECYNSVWDNNNGYYNEDFFCSVNEKEAKAFLDKYLKSGTINTYGILVKNFVGEEEFKEIASGEDDGFDYMNYSINNIIYSAYKNDNNEIITNFIDTTNVAKTLEELEENEEESI